MKKNIYFDNSATTPLDIRVAEKINDFQCKEFGNPSSIHSFGRKAKVLLEEAREICADFINADASEIFFTSNGTESNNFIIKGIGEAEKRESGKNHIATTKTEHSSVLQIFNKMEETDFFSTLLNVDSYGKVSKNDLQTLSNTTSLLSFIHINNETGNINELEKIASYLREKNIYLHTDAVQSFGKVPIDVKKINLNALTASAHKIGGPKGVGFAYIKAGTPITPLLIGGSQERNLRGGTENIAGIIGLAEAVKIAELEMKDTYNHVGSIKTKFVENIFQLDGTGITINSTDDSSPFILSLTFLPELYNVDLESMLMYFDINGIAISSGAACSSGTLKPSHVMINSGKSREEANSTIRFSFWKQNTIDEINYTCDVLEKFIQKFRKQKS